MFAEGVPGELSLAGMAALTDAEFDSMIADFQRAFCCWRELDAVVIAAVQGYAIGAGFQLALGADIIVAADDVAFCMKETQLGLVPDLAGTHPLVSTVGYSAALEICASGRLVGADEAVKRGIAVSAVPVGLLDDEVNRIAQSFLTALPQATVETKHLLAGALQRTRGEQCVAERAAQRRQFALLSKMFS
jgi:enoyl-CoA hydratase/carnithine racemase